MMDRLCVYHVNWINMNLQVNSREWPARKFEFSLISITFVIIDREKTKQVFFFFFFFLLVYCWIIILDSWHMALRICFLVSMCMLFCLLFIFMISFVTISNCVSLKWLSCWHRDHLEFRMCCVALGTAPGPIAHSPLSATKPPSVSPLSTKRWFERGERWSPSELFGGEGGVTPWTSGQFVTGHTDRRQQPLVVFRLSGSPSPGESPPSAPRDRTQSLVPARWQWTAATWTVTGQT